mgnify:CR=1 FL=1
MNEETKKLLKRTFNFGVDCLLYLNNLPIQEKFKVPKYQLAKSSTSNGANYEEAQAGESKKDFIHKIGIISKEDKNIDIVTLKNLITESVEFKKIFTIIKINSSKNGN